MGLITIFNFCEATSSKSKTSMPYLIWDHNGWGDKLPNMTRANAFFWSICFVLVGGGGLGYLLWAIPPTLANAQWNLAVIALFLAALALLSSGIGTIIALALHRRWPALSGVRARRAPQPETAVRQGVWLGITITIWAVLALLRLVDITFILITVLLVGLLETFIQSRQTR
jgi:hypothetical protein